MPVYEYMCHEGCESVYELVRKIAEMNDPVLCEDPHCIETHGAQLECKRIISLPAQPVFVGVSPKEQRHEAVKKRHENYVKSDKFREQKREQIYKLAKKGTIPVPTKR